MDTTGSSNFTKMNRMDILYFGRLKGILCIANFWDRSAA